MSTQAPTILLIERDAVTLEIYQRELRKDFTVLGFTEIEEVLEALAERDVQAVIIEPEIGAGQGWDLIGEIRTTFPERAIPVIVCTTRDAAPAGFVSVVNRFLTKPVLPKALREATRKVLRARDAARERP